MVADHPEVKWPTLNLVPEAPVHNVGWDKIPTFYAQPDGHESFDWSFTNGRGELGYEHYNRAEATAVDPCPHRP